LGAWKGRADHEVIERRNLGYRNEIFELPPMKFGRRGKRSCRDFGEL